ncbi:MAG: hypothetical protein JWP70_197, partial [Leifsonia sp.]|nr:hypothetical protein [Leifsonia sp.]
VVNVITILVGFEFLVNITWVLGVTFMV